MKAPSGLKLGGLLWPFWFNVKSFQTTDVRWKREVWMLNENQHNHSSEGKDLEKLRVLLPHWIEHNQEHAASFQRWAVRARKLDRQEAARRIEEAVESAEQTTEKLAAALEALGS